MVPSSGKVSWHPPSGTLYGGYVSPIPATGMRKRACISGGKRKSSMR
jgi:hypothetical protein